MACGDTWPLTAYPLMITFLSLRALTGSTAPTLQAKLECCSAPPTSSGTPMISCNRPRSTLPDTTPASTCTWGKTPVAHLNDLEFLGPELSCAHAVWLTADDIELLAQSGATVCHNASSN